MTKDPLNYNGVIFVKSNIHVPLYYNVQVVDHRSKHQINPSKGKNII